LYMPSTDPSVPDKDIYRAAMTAIIAPIAPKMGPAVATAPLVEAAVGPVEAEEPVETEPLPETTEVTIVVPLLLDEIVATEDATGAVVVALLTEETTPFPPPSEGERPPDWVAVDAEAITDAEPEGEVELEETPAGDEDVDEGVVLEEAVAAGQVRLYSGVVLNIVPTIPKLGFGVVG
jgi:hypothetical protein